MRFRDRDAPVTPEGLIFRTYGYDHPPGGCFCDLEYAPQTVYQTENPRALRTAGPARYYKFYYDGGLRFVEQRYPEYTLPHRALGRRLVGVWADQLARLLRPDARLKELMEEEGDPLLEAAADVVNTVCDASSLRPKDFGVFGSLAHGFHNPLFSDIDLVVYGTAELRELRETLVGLYGNGALRNEFEGWTAEMPPHRWGFTRYSKEEYGWHQRRKLVYAVYASEGLGRQVKVEFEPVRRWEEAEGEYEATERIERLGRVEAVVDVAADDEAGFIPSLYPIEALEVDPPMIQRRDLRRVVSYLEEFRLQIEEGERALVRGELERVEARDGEFYQIALSHGPGRFDQALKVRGR